MSSRFIRHGHFAPLSVWQAFSATCRLLPELYKLIGSLLCRQLIAIRKFELWFTFGRHPLRFSLDEFHDVTGLNCGSFDVGDSDADEAPGSTMWNKLFDTTLGGITVSQVLEMLRNPFLAGWKRVPLALIALVDGVVCCNDKILKLTRGMSRCSTTSKPSCRIHGVENHSWRPYLVFYLPQSVKL